MTFLGVMVLTGWYAGLPMLTHIVPAWATMKANTAACFLLSGLVLLRATYHHGRVHTDKIGAILFALIALIALMSLVEYGAGHSFGLDELLVQDQESRLRGQPPGRMSPATSVSFILLSLGLWMVDYSGLSCVLCLAGMALPLLALIGFLYKTEALYAVRPFATVALHTAIGFMIFGLGCLTLRRRQGIVPLLRSSYADIARTRPLLAGALLLPPVFGLLCLAGQRQGWYAPEFTLGLMTVLLMLATCLLLWSTSQTGRKMEHKRRVAERELQTRTEELMKSSEALEQYAYAAAHDLQEPLRMISIYAQLLGRDSREQLGSNERQYLEILRSSAGRVSKMVTDLLLHSRILAQSEVPRTEVDLNEVLRDVLTQLSVRISDTGAQVMVDRLPSVVGEFDQFVYLFQNLLENALKYRNPDTVPHVQISVREEQWNWVFSVTDNGLGFDMKYAKQIFGVFKRLHGQEIPGTGMGLAISQRMVEQQHGRIWAESQPGTGSTFYISLSRLSDSIDREQLASHRPLAKKTE